jgi:hypothetical protein
MSVEASQGRASPKKKQRTAGARDVYESEAKALAAPADAKKVDWERVPTDVLARVMLSFLSLSETVRFQGVQKRMATLPAGAITLPKLEMTEDELGLLEDEPDWVASFEQKMPIWSRGTVDLTLEGKTSGWARWFRPDTFSRLKKLRVHHWRVTDEIWTSIMQSCPKLHDLVVDEFIMSTGMTVDIWKNAVANRPWTVVVLNQIQDSRMGAGAATMMFHSFANRKLQKLVMTWHVRDSSFWALDDSKAFVAKIDAAQFRHWGLDVLLGGDVNAHILYLLQSLPGLQDIDLPPTGPLAADTVQLMLKTWSFLTAFPPRFVRMSPNTMPTDVALPADRKWTELAVTEARGFRPDWSLKHLLPLLKRSTSWRRVTWDRFSPGEMIDSKTFDLIVQQLRAPLLELYLLGPVVVSHENLLALARVPLATSAGWPSHYVLGPSQDFGDHLLQPDLVPQTNLTASSLIDFLNETGEQSQYKYMRRCVLEISYTPLQEARVSDLFLLFYSDRVDFSFWVRTTELDNFHASYPPNHPIHQHVLVRRTIGNYSYVSNRH